MRRIFIGGTHVAAVKSVTWAASVDAQAGGVEAAQRRDAARPAEQRVAERVVRRAERRHDADARHAHRRLHAPYVTIAVVSVPVRRFAIAAAIAACAALCASGAPAAAQKKDARTPDVFDELYSRGKKANDAMKTLSARFTETTTSSLLTKPLVAHGRVAVERPSRVILRYTEPDVRTVLIESSKMTMSWPSRHIKQVTDIGTAQGRVQKYFINGTAEDLRNQFDIEDHGTSDKPNTYYVSMAPKRKQIRENLVKLDLWIDRTSLLLDTMKMTFANGDSKTMAFEDVVPNAALPADAFVLER